MPVNELARSLRIRLGLSQRQMAEKLGTDAPYVSRIERGMYGLGELMAARYAKVTGVDIRRFLSAMQKVSL